MQWLLRAFDTHGLPSPHFALTVTHAAFRYPVVAATDLVSIGTRRWLKQFSREHNLTEIPVRELVWRRPVGVSYRKDAYLSPAAKRFIEILKNTAEFPDARRPLRSDLL
jgi:DNA-binding transcriptional LysR family regulator